MKISSFLAPSAVSLIAVATIGLMSATTVHSAERSCIDRVPDNKNKNGNCTTGSLHFKKGENLKYGVSTCTDQGNLGHGKCWGRGTMRLIQDGKKLRDFKVYNSKSGQWKVKKTGWYKIAIAADLRGAKHHASANIRK